MCYSHIVLKFMLRTRSRYAQVPKIFLPSLQVSTFHSLPYLKSSKLLSTRCYTLKGTLSRQCVNGGMTRPQNSSQILENHVTTNYMINELLKLIWPKGNTKVKLTVLATIGLLAIGKLFNISIPFFYKCIIDSLNLSVTGEISSAVAIPFALIFAYGAARIGSSVFNELRNFVFETVAQRAMRSISRKIFDHIHNLDLSFHLSRNTGSLSRAMDRGTKAIRDIMAPLVITLVPTFFEVLVTAGILWYNFGWQFVVTTIGCIGSYTGYSILVTNWRSKFRDAKNRADQRAANQALESLINFETIKYYNNEPHESKCYDNTLGDYRDMEMKLQKSLSILNTGQNVIIGSALALIIYLSAKGIQSGLMTMGDLVMASTLLFQLSIPLNMLGSSYRNLVVAAIDMEYLFKLFKKQPIVKSSENAPPLVISQGTATVRFENVHFSYSEERHIFTGLTFEIPSGKTVALVGASGSGKSSVLRLLYRFYDPTCGKIYINDQDIGLVDLRSLREHIGVVPQDCVLFNSTILENVRYGNLDASNEQVYRATAMAEISNLIKLLPDGYNTVVGERGLKLSGGEKQRIAIARTLLKTPNIVFFDEATSSLDSMTEKLIISSMRKATAHTTCLIIAHRLSTIVDADQILVLQDGKISEQGTHLELLADPSSIYSSLWRTQMSIESTDSPDMHRRMVG